MLRDKIDYADNTCTRDNTHAEPPKEVFVPITNYTIDMEEAIKDAQVLMITVPGYAVDDYAELLAPIVGEDQVIFFNAAAAMSCVRFANKAKAMGNGHQQEIQTL